jgi:type-2 restriction enzyme hgiDI
MTHESGLYGIVHSNRSAEQHWSKNCFNSSFPTAMANYMMAKELPALYVTLGKKNGKLTVCSTQISIRELFRCGSLPADSLDFCFESIFEPYQAYSFDKIDGIDLVIKNLSGTPLAPLEVKLTVLPTSDSSGKSPSQWGCELVVRSATTSYCAFGMFDAIKERHAEIREIFEPACSSIQSWDNTFEMSHKTGALCEALDRFEERFFANQRPLVMEPIWKTQGQSPLLDEQAFCLVVWSDYAFSRLFIDRAKTDGVKDMTRYMRAAAKFARCLWELGKSGKIHVNDIYRQMAFGNQTDKEFAVHASMWRRYVDADRLPDFMLRREILHEIIMEGFIERLRPERRFDQTLYFTMKPREIKLEGRNSIG